MGHIKGPPASNMSESRSGISARFPPASLSAASISARPRPCRRFGKAFPSTARARRASSWAAAGSEHAQAASSPPEQSLAEYCRRA